MTDREQERREKALADLDLDRYERTGFLDREEQAIEHWLRGHRYRDVEIAEKDTEIERLKEQIKTHGHMAVLGLNEIARRDAEIERLRDEVTLRDAKLLNVEMKLLSAERELREAREAVRKACVLIGPQSLMPYDPEVADWWATPAVQAALKEAK